MSRSHRSWRELLGSYVLGHLTTEETAEVRQHLDTCEECRTEVAELMPLRDLLNTVTPDGLLELRDEVVPDPALAARVLAAVAATPGPDSPGSAVALNAGSSRHRGIPLNRRRHRTRTLGAVAAAAAILAVAVGSGVAIGRQLPGSDPAPSAQPAAVPTEAVALVASPDPTTPDDTATVQFDDAYLVNHTWGTELRIVATGFTVGEVYQAWFVDRTGSRIPAGEFVGVGATTMTCNLQSAALRADVTAVRLTSADGAVIAEADLPT